MVKDSHAPVNLKDFTPVSFEIAFKRIAAGEDVYHKVFQPAVKKGDEIWLKEHYIICKFDSSGIEIPKALETEWFVHINDIPARIEIERKYLVLIDQLPVFEGGELIKQGYLSKDPPIRIRLVNNNEACITIKQAALFKREEFEYPIPRIDGNRLIKMCKRVITKIRYKFPFEGRTWEIDQFFEDLSGGWLAEVEIDSEDATIIKPPWIGKEVTMDIRYNNMSLVENGFPAQE
ncbi:MAG: CYTH domain-containing protein [Lentisphaeria bacterium]|jgi:CYTH domain-containing protein